MLLAIQKPILNIQLYAQIKDNKLSNNVDIRNSDASPDWFIAITDSG